MSIKESPINWAALNYNEKQNKLNFIAYQNSQQGKRLTKDRS
jgi:hypothetical protein